MTHQHVFILCKGWVSSNFPTFTRALCITQYGGVSSSLA